MDLTDPTEAALLCSETFEREGLGFALFGEGAAYPAASRRIASIRAFVAASFTATRIASSARRGMSGKWRR